MDALWTWHNHDKCYSKTLALPTNLQNFKTEGVRMNEIACLFEEREEEAFLILS